MRVRRDLQGFGVLREIVQKEVSFEQAVKNDYQGETNNKGARTKWTEGMVGTQTKSGSGQTAQEICTETQEPMTLILRKTSYVKLFPFWGVSLSLKKVRVKTSEDDIIGVMVDVFQCQYFNIVWI